MAYSCDAFPREQRETRETGEGNWRKRLERKTRERDQQDTRDEAMADGLTQNNEVARECQREIERAREEIQSYLDNLVTDKQTYPQVL